MVDLLDELAGDGCLHLLKTAFRWQCPKADHDLIGEIMASVTAAIMEDFPNARVLVQLLFQLLACA
ncbi:hypothetical protein GBL_1826 [Geobacillus kaustophilus GBlys]|uniref:Uncharacterized protein n=1 Tax=Geobacillus kaustophilus GBlys TaxID=1337888 RepID=U2Y355_GEOKU|nr:hypothetical protein GBL_1826 [Geobacillus kaustophilus GBlys]